VGTGEEDAVLTTKNTDAKITKDLTMRDPLVVTLLLLAGVSGHARQAPETARHLRSRCHPSSEAHGTHEE
jgi:hypothetical protein